MTHQSWRSAVGAALGAALIATPLAALPAQAEEAAPAPGVVINEAYVNGGSANAPFNTKFVELFNTSDAPVSLDGWSLQYRSGTGTAAPTGLTELSGSIPANGYFLVSGASNGDTGVALPEADVVGNLNTSGTRGTLVLSDGNQALAQLPTGSVIGGDGVNDLLGYGSSNTFETAPADGPGGTTNPVSINREAGADTDDNSADFTLSEAVTPTNAAGETADGGTEEPTPTDPPVPSDPVTIAAIQGTGDATPLAGQSVTTTGVVTAAYATGGLDGYYIQTPGTGGEPASHTASDAVFVYSPSTVGNVSLGDHVQVTGIAGEFYDQTQITVQAEGLKILQEPAEAVKALTIGWPDADQVRETFEGMLWAPSGEFTVSDNYSLNQYGELTLAAGTEPLRQPTDVAAPGTEENAAVAASNEARQVGLDDGASTNFFNAANQDQPLPYLTSDEHVRVNGSVTFTTDVVLSFSHGNWKFQPLKHLTADNAETVQPASFDAQRPAAPQTVGGDVQIASFNVLNYFTTTGDQLSGCSYYTDRDGNPISVRGGCLARGAANAENLQRQQDKIVAAINALGADVVSLEEIENSAKFGKDRDEALATLTEALNAAAPGTWDYVRSPADLPALENEDVIRTAFIYRTAAVETVGESVILDDNTAFSNARKPLAQTFKAAGAPDTEAFIAIVNHFKSKGSAPDSGPNADQGDGQGAWNAARVAQAEALVAFADQLKTDAGTDKVFLTGDFNSYSAEDPIKVLEAAGYINQGAKSGKHSYVFSGQVGSLDHIFASAAADAGVTGTDVWNINSAESVALEYSRYNYNVVNFYEPDVFRASDHDPVIVGFNATGTEPATTEINLLNINDFHGRIDSNTVNFAGTIEMLKEEAPDGQSLFLSAGDNIGASLFASSVQQDQPTIDVMEALNLKASAVGNHEFDGGWADLRDRVQSSADFPYLGANVYAKGTTDPVLPEYELLDVAGVDVAVIGVVTEQTPTLVSPDGIADLEFGDPVEAVNRVAQELDASGAADVIIAEYHEGASGVADATTIEDKVAQGGAFAEIVNNTTPLVDAIYTGHTHQIYAWDAPIAGTDGQTRPIVQTGSYGEHIGQITLQYNEATDEVESYTAENVARTTTDAATLVKRYPAVAEVKTIVDAALAKAAEIGNQKVGSVTADITTAFVNGERDDRTSESTLGNLVADSLLASLGSAERGGAEIGVVNPGGLRNELYYGEDGTITYAEANAVLPFLNNLWTTTLTGTQIKTMLEQQWQPEGSSRAFLALGLSDNVTYSYNPDLPAGERIQSVVINGEPLEADRGYRVGTFSFLAQGGDNFSVFTEGTDTRDSGLVDREAWISYIETNSPLSPDFARQGVIVKNAPSTVSAGQDVSFEVAQLNLTSLGSPANTELAVSFVDDAGAATSLGTVPVSEGAATVSVTVPENVSGSGAIVLVAEPTDTTVTLPVSVEAGDVVECVQPQRPTAWWDFWGWVRYAIDLVEYKICLRLQS